LGTEDPANGFVVVTQAGGQLFGAIVDNVFHTEEIVIKPMSSKHCQLFVLSPRKAPAYRQNA
jgi:chemotaxis protein histidine kinase CheA